MSVPAVDFESPATHGVVSRQGNYIEVAPPTLDAHGAWAHLAHDLVRFAGGQISESGAVQIPSTSAHEVARVLGQPWPAGLFTWDWHPDAKEALTTATKVAEAVSAMLSVEPPSNAPLCDLAVELAGSGFVRTLLASQTRAVEQLLANQGGGNFSVPGSGKTTMTYALYAVLRGRGAVDRMLVVAPQSAYEAWQEEAQVCFDNPKTPSVEIAPRTIRRSTEVAVLNYERLSAPHTRAAIHAWAQGRKLLVVFDEAHRAKRGADGSHGRGALDTTSMATRRLVLTGTPMPNGEDDLAAILELAYPGHGQLLASASTVNASRAWVRVTKDELELEPANHVLEEVVLDESHLRVYRAIADGLQEDLTVLEEFPEAASQAVARMIACASNPGLLGSAIGVDGQLEWPAELPNTAKSLGEVMSDIGGAARPAKLLAAARHAKAHAERGEKLLVWTNFIGNVSELERLLAPFGVACVTGAVPQFDPSAPTDRTRELQRFRDDPECTVLVATPQTLGEGVSLHHACQSQLHVDRTFNAGLYLQAMDRTHRVGMPPGTSAKTVSLVAKGTIDEAVDASLRRKLTEMNERLNDPTLRLLAEPALAEPAYGSTQDYDELIKHLRGA